MKKIFLGALVLLIAVTSCNQPKNPDQLFSEEAMEYIKTVPYDVNRTALYSAEDLYAGYDPAKPETFDSCYDTKVYQHYIATGKQAKDVEESLARTLHDHCIHVALDEFFKEHNSRLCIGIMGGHALLRTDPMYKKVVLLSKRLTEEGFIMLSGGGPGAMEATHLGAWLAGREEADVDDAVEMLTVAPSFKDEGWLASSFEVMKKYPRQGDYVSLGIPTTSMVMSHQLLLPLTSPSSSRTASVKTLSSPLPLVVSSTRQVVLAPCRRSSKTLCRTTTSPSASPAQ